MGLGAGRCPLLNALQVSKLPKNKALQTNCRYFYRFFPVLWREVAIFFRKPLRSVTPVEAGRVRYLAFLQPSACAALLMGSPDSTQPIYSLTTKRLKIGT